MNSSTQAPVYLSRREMRAAGVYDSAPDAATPTAPTPLIEPAAAQPVTGGIAALFPLLGSPSAALDSAETVEAASAASHPVTESTLAMPVAAIEAELATPVPALVVEQEPIAPIVAAPVVAAPVVAPSAVAPSAVAAPAVAAVPPVPTPSASASAAAQLDVDAIFGFATSGGRATDVPVEVAATRGGRPKQTRPKQTRLKPTRAKRGRPAAAPAAAVVRAASDRKSIRQRATGLGVMVLVGGLFAVLALPAYADNDASSLSASAASTRTQKLTVSAAAATETTTSIARDGYTATSAADLKSLYADAIRKQNLAAYMQSGAKAQGDDYPWFAELSRNQGGGLSPLNYYYRECVDFVAWRLNRDAGSTTVPFKFVWSTLTPSGGNASQWKSAWLNHGWPTGATPKVGAVAWFTYNHVGYVSGILNDGSVLIEEYNWEGDHNYSTRVIAAGDAYYLYAPPA